MVMSGYTKASLLLVGVVGAAILIGMFFNETRKPTPAPASIEWEDVMDPEEVGVGWFCSRCDRQIQVPGKHRCVADVAYAKGFRAALIARMFYDLEIQLGEPRRTNGEINELLCERRGIVYDHKGITITQD